MKTFQEIVRAVQQHPPRTLATPKPEEAIVITAIDEAYQLGLVKPILIGDPAKIASAAEAADVDTSPFEIIDEPDPVAACNLAVTMVCQGRVQMLSKGSVDTKVIMHAVVGDHRMRAGGLMSHVAIVQSARYDRLFFVSDGGINISPSVEEKADIIRNAVWVAHQLEVPEPRVAILAAVEKVNEKIAATVDADRLVREYTFPGAIVSGPMAPDSAVDFDVAAIKGLGEDPVAGRADILICPDINSCNMMVRAMLYFGDATWGGIVAGAKAPIVLTSRADTDPAMRVNSIAVAAYVGIRQASGTLSASA